MLIIGDEKRHSGFPWITLLLIVLNCAAFLAQVGLGDPVTYGYCMVPVEIRHGEDLVGLTPPVIHEPGSGPVIRTARTVDIRHQPGPRPIYLTLVTSMFLHGGLLHLFGNMAFLMVFGRNVERAMGSLLFLAFYIVCGVAAALVHICVAPYSAVPYIGASGAISAVIGAYVFLFPVIWMRIWIGFEVIELPAIIVVGAWVLLQVINTLHAFEAGEVTSGVAYWVHVGGFVAGIIFLITLLIALRIRYALTPRSRRGGPLGRPRTHQSV